MMVHASTPVKIDEHCAYHELAGIDGRFCSLERLRNTDEGVRTPGIDEQSDYPVTSAKLGRWQKSGHTVRWRASDANLNMDTSSAA